MVNLPVIACSEGRLTTYAAKFNLAFFTRKKIPSYALWSVYVKEGNRYPKIPQGYGAAATLEDARAELQAFINSHSLNWQYVRDDGTERWARVKKLIIIRDSFQGLALPNKL